MILIIKRALLRIRLFIRESRYEMRRQQFTQLADQLSTDRRQITLTRLAIADLDGRHRPSLQLVRPLCGRSDVH